jgi:hypothetical protein
MPMEWQVGTKEQAHRSNQGTWISEYRSLPNSHPPDTITYPMVGETENASHTENLTLPAIPAYSFLVGLKFVA